MSEKNTQAKPGDTVELADKDTGFYDPKTGLKLVREQTAKLGDTIGKATNVAILSGRLLIVSGSKSGIQRQQEQDDLDIPQDLPGREAFVAAGYTTFDSIKALDSDEKLLAVKGIGQGTVKNLKAWAAANAPKE